VAQVESRHDHHERRVNNNKINKQGTAAAPHTHTHTHPTNDTTHAAPGVNPHLPSSHTTANRFYNSTARTLTDAETARYRFFTTHICLCFMHFTNVTPKVMH
jgi:hypothetical protein